MMENYYFTFGMSSPRGKCYVCICAASWERARLEMDRRYGNNWAFQYSAEKWFEEGASMAYRWNLTQIPTSRRTIESMSYGTPEQLRAADLWIKRFINRFIKTIRHNKEPRNDDAGDLFAERMQIAYNKVMTRDVFYQARVRWNEEINAGQGISTS